MAFTTFLSCNKAGALKQYQQILSRNPNDYESRMRMAYCHSVLGDRSQAAAQYRETANRSNSQCIRDVNNALAIGCEGQYAKCLEMLSGAASKYKESFLVWHNLGEMNSMLGNTSAASKAFAEATRLNPNDPWNRVLYGEVLRAQGDHKQAREQYEKAIECNSQVTLAHAGLALCKLGQGDVAAAKQHMKTANSINPNLVPITDPFLYREIRGKHFIQLFYSVNNFIHFQVNKTVL